MAPEPGPARTVVFFHAHPDDEAIFTGGTMALLAAAGWRVVLVVATAGEQGLRVGAGRAGGPAGRPAHGARRPGGRMPRGAAGRVPRLPRLRARRAGDRPVGAFADAPVAEAAARLAGILAEERAAALVSYDARGIYGHVDHVQVHQVGLGCRRRGRRADDLRVDRRPGVPPLRRDPPGGRGHRRHPAGAGRLGLGLAAAPLGLSTVEVDCTVDVRPVLTVKRRAMAAHASQIPETSSAMRLPDAGFAAVYGYEWYARRGPVGPIDELV